MILRDRSACGAAGAGWNAQKLCQLTIRIGPAAPVDTVARDQQRLLRRKEPLHHRVYALGIRLRLWDVG